MFKQARSRDMVTVLVYTKAHSAKHLLTIITTLPYISQIGPLQILLRAFRTR